MRFRLRPEEGWLSLFLLALVVNSVAWSIEEADWAEGLFILQWCAFWGIVSGLFLARSGWRGLIAHPLGSALGTSWVLFLLLRLVAPGMGWWERLEMLATRLLDWLRVALGQGVSEDNLVFLLLMAFLVWILGYLGAWFLFRYHTAWPAVILSGVSLLINRYYGPSELNIWLVIYLLTALLLIIRANLYGREQEWRRAEVRYGPDSATDFLRDGALFSLLVIAIAWLVPLITWNVSHPQEWGGEDLWDRAQKQFNRLFSSLRSYRRGGEYVAFGDRLTLKGAVHLGSEIVMVVEAPEGRYWRGMVYDQYDGRGWQNTDSQYIDIEPHTQIPQEGRQFLRRELTQRITLYQPTGGQLLAAPQPVWTDLPVEARLTVYSRGRAWGERRLPEAVAGVSALTSKLPVGPQRPYIVVSSLPQVSEDLLRQGSYLPDWTVYRSGPEGFVSLKLREDPSLIYPSWVRDRYLQLPPTLPPRVKELARKLTEDYDNVYDKAAALESYLRQTSYNEDIEAPPPERDAVDYFLFDSREGYCDYYASAMAVMARAMGIPARLAVGYAGGEYDEERGGFVVRRYRAHAWVEIFLPGFGWIEFEPTASEPPIFRRELERVWEQPTEEQAAVLDIRERLQRGEPPPLAQPPRTRLHWYDMSFLWKIVLLGFLVAAFISGLVWWRGREDLPTAEGIYRRLVFYARFLGVQPLPAQTPTEYANRLVGEIPEEREGAFRLVALYLRERFSREGLDSLEKMEAYAIWQDLSRAISQKIPQRLIQFIGSLRGLIGRGLRTYRHRPFREGEDGGDRQG